MPKPQLSPVGRGNRLLDRLPEADYLRLVPLLKHVEMPADLVLYEARAVIEYAYFPIGAVGSALAVMEDGSAIEVATVGNEGLIGHSAVGGGKSSPNRMIVQIGDGGLRIGIASLCDEVARGGGLRDLLDDYRTTYSSQVSQSVACNGLHRLEQRCCRWLLMSRDRVGSDDLRLTHEYLAIMLGARRASITEVLKPLQEAGLVRSQRGLLVIIDGVGLEARACECYRVVRDEYDRLLGPHAGGPGEPADDPIRGRPR